MDDSIYHRLPAPGLLADLILVLHVAVVLFVIGGQLAVLVGAWRGWRWVRSALFRYAHLATLLVVVLQAWLGRLCPLTLWEQGLRRAAGQLSYEESFIAHWLGRMIFFDVPLIVFAVIYSLFAALVLWSWWWLPPRRPFSRDQRG